VFVVLGTSSLSVLNETPDIEASDMSRFKYVLNNDDPDQMPAVQIGDTLTQTSGFAGTVTYIDSTAKVIKLENCSGIALLDRALPLTSNGGSIGDIFCYELYLKVVSLNGAAMPFPAEYPTELASQSLNISVVHTNTSLEYTENYRWNVIGDPSATVKVQMASCNLDMNNTRALTAYGRYA
jgi:hypothetical protein